MEPANSVFDGRAFCQGVTSKPGVYRMLDSGGTILYVGKARNLKKRLSSYFRPPEQLTLKTRSLVSKIAAVEITVTHTENEALILESNLIKEHKPRFNILLRDGKGYPYIYIASDQPYPRLSFHRGARSGKGQYFGPYPSVLAVRSSINLLQRLFRIRNCEDSVFQNRTRPCLQYQIKRCTAPCVGLVTPDQYREDVNHAALFLDGKSEAIIKRLVERMEKAAEQLQFEQAMIYRDQIAALKQVQQRQYVSTGSADLDVVVCLCREQICCIQVFFIRGGQNLGNQTFFPEHAEESEVADILSAFLSQFYLATRHNDRLVPEEIVTNSAVTDAHLLAEVLSEQAGRKVTLHHQVRSERAKFLQIALNNAEIALLQRLSDRNSRQRRIQGLQDVLRLDKPIERIECFDISHTLGEATVASCVVFNANGAVKADYRRFNITNIQPGDDYAAMHQALHRRYSRVLKEEGRLPQLLLIDGGKQQVAQAQKVMTELAITSVAIIGVAKGPSRKPGLETLILAEEGRELELPPDSPALHMLQQIRDEAHRFAIAGHRNRRAKARQESALEGVEGIGPKRRRQLIQHFGGLQGIVKAGIDDLTMVPGISRDLATRIYQRFHG